MDARIQLLLDKLTNCKLDGILISTQTNAAYLSRFKAQDSYLLISRHKNYFITDFRYTCEAKTNISNFKIFQYKNLFQDIADLAIKLKIRRLGFESKDLNFAEYSRLKDCLPAKIKLIDTFNIIEDIRKIKDAQELKFIRQAIEITNKTFQHLKKFIKPGLTELQIAAETEHFIRHNGAQTSAFDIIIASGPNSSYPHALVTNRKIKKGELVLLDIGVQINGYKSDLTRVFFLDKINSFQRRIFEIVKEAQAKAFEVIKPGALICEVDAASHNFIKKCGYGRYFGHSLGHGVGLDIHEEPSVSSKNKSIAQEGMVFTIEPGIYIPNKFGIRLEDMIYVTKEGVEVLSGAVNKSI